MKRWFLTVDWCNKGKRGIFASINGNAFSKEAQHTEDEMGEGTRSFAQNPLVAQKVADLHKKSGGGFLSHGISNKPNWGNILADFGRFSAFLCIVAGILLAFQIRLPLAYLNFLLVCGIILGILLVIYVIDCLRDLLAKKKPTESSHKHNSDSNPKVTESLIKSNEVNIVNIPQDKNCPDDFRYRSIAQSFLAKVKKRYIISRGYYK